MHACRLAALPSQREGPKYTSLRFQPVPKPSARMARALYSITSALGILCTLHHACHASLWGNAAIAGVTSQPILELWLMTDRGDAASYKDGPTPSVPSKLIRSTIVGPNKSLDYQLAHSSLDQTSCAITQRHQQPNQILRHFSICLLGISLHPPACMPAGTNKLVSYFVCCPLDRLSLCRPVKSFLPCQAA